MSILTHNKRGGMPWAAATLRPPALLQNAAIPDCVMNGVAALLDIVLNWSKVRRGKNICRVGVNLKYSRPWQTFRSGPTDLS